MSTTRSAARSRYRTVLPSFIHLDKNEAPHLAAVYKENQAYSQESSGGRSTTPPLPPSHNEPKYDTTRLPLDSTDRQAMLDADSTLPYHRFLRRGNAKQTAIQLGLLDEGASTTSGGSSTSPQLSKTETSNSSNSYPIHSPDTVQNSPKKSSPFSVANELPKSPSRIRGSSISYNPPLSGSTADAPNEYPPLPGPAALSPRTPSRLSVANDRILPSPRRNQPVVRDFTEQHAAPVKSPLRESRLDHTKPRTLPRLRSPPLRAGTETPTKTVSRPRPKSSEVESSIDYESVDGVSLDTLPVAASANQADMSIPEIEARDIRQIEHPTDYDEGVLTNESVGDADLEIHAVHRYGDTGTHPSHSVAQSLQQRLQDTQPRPMKVNSTKQLKSPRHIPILPNYDQVARDEPPEKSPIQDEHIRAPSAAGQSELPISPIPQSIQKDPPEITSHDRDLIQSAEPPSIALSKEEPEQSEGGGLARVFHVAKSLIGRGH